jgi:hypothetical protein
MNGIDRAVRQAFETSPKSDGTADVRRTAVGTLACSFTANWASRVANSNSRSALPQAVRHWTLTTLREKLIKIGAKVARHFRKIVFQMAEAGSLGSFSATS